MKYRWLLFDADGTLFDYDRAEAHALTETFTQIGLGFQNGYLESYRQINNDLWRAFEQGEISQEKLKVERFQILCQVLNMTADPAELSKIYLANLAKGIYLIEGAKEMIAVLSAQYRLAIITNGLKDVQRPRFANSAIVKHFTAIVISEEVGVAKPDSRIFDITFKHMGQPGKGEVLIIGDSLTSDIAGGVNYGIDTCWYNPEGRERPSNLNIRYEIRSLSELPGLLEVT